MIRLICALLLALLVTCLGPGCSQKAKQARHLQRADKYFGAGDLAKAEIEYLNVLRFDPRHPRAIASLGSIYYDQGRFGRAGIFLLQGCEFSPQDTALRQKLGMIHLLRGETKEAADQAFHILQAMPNHPEAPSLLAETARSKREAQALKERFAKLYPQGMDTAPLQVALGTLLLRMGEAKEGEASFKRAVALDPKFSAGHAALGRLAWAQNDLKGAASELKLAAEFAPPRSLRRLSYAEFKLRTGDLEEGNRLLQEITKETPEYLPAWIRQAEIALAKTNINECSALLNQVLARDPASYEGLMLNGRLYLLQGEPSKAIAEFERLDKICKTPSGPVQYQLGVAYLRNKEPNKAYGFLSRAVSLDPDLLEAKLMLAEMNLRKGETDIAIAALTEVIQQRPQIHQAHLLLAMAYSSQKTPRLDEAAAVYQRMMQLFPNSPRVPLLLGLVRGQQKKYPEARKAVEKALEMLPGYLPAITELVNLDLAEKNYSDALDRTRKHLGEKPNSLEYNSMLAKIYWARAQETIAKAAAPAGGVAAAQDDLKQAESALLKVIELAPGSPPAYTMLAQLYVQSNKHQQAIDRLNALATSTNLSARVSALTQIGMIYNELKNHEAYRDTYEKLLSINPDFTLALNNLAYLYSEHFNDPEKALVMAEKARQLLPSSPFAADTLGWVLYKKGDYSRALALVEESALVLQEPEVRFHLGMISYMLGDEASARGALEQAMQADTQFRENAEARRRLALLAIDVKSADANTVADLEKRLQEMPNDPIALARLAAIYERDGSLDRAIQMYERAIKQNPRNARLLGQLAKLYSGQPQRREKALELAKAAHKLAPEDPQIDRLLGSLVYLEHDYKWALSLLQDASRSLPEDPEIQYELAWAYYQMGRVAEAETSMKTALNASAAFSKTEQAKTFLLFIAAAQKPGEAGRAAAQAQEKLAAEADYLPALIVLALVHEQKGEFNQAKQLYEKVAAANPLFKVATRNLAVLLVNHFPDDPKAYDFAVKARQAFPDDSEVARALGIVAYRRGEYARAAQLLSEAAQKLSEDPERFYYLGMAHYKLKQNAQSKDALQRALALNVGANLANDAKRVLLELK